MSRDGNEKKPGFVGRTIGKVRDVGASALRGMASRIEGPKASFEAGGAPIEFQFDIGGETIWATQAQIADLFGVDRSVIAKHVLNVFLENELEASPATCAKIAQVRMEGSREVSREIEHYSLDVILAVGYRVSGKRATQFRQWATSKLGAYVRDGYVLNEDRLREDPVSAESLAERVRDIRFSEKNVYERVRLCVTMVASDYDGSSDQVRSFFARMQDKFHYAACEMTAHQLVLSRADGSKEMMGMSSHLGDRLTLSDAKTGKNYLAEKELRLEKLAGEAFFVYVENMAERGRTLTTAQLLTKIDEVFKFNEMPIFPGYGAYLKDRAHGHATVQYNLFKGRTDQERYDASRRPPRR